MITEIKAQKEINPYDLPKGYFAAQVIFAAKWSEFEKIPLADALRYKTGAYLKLGLWYEIESGIEKSGSLNEVVDLLWEKYKATDWAKFESTVCDDGYHFGCFLFDKPFAGNETIRIHFNNLERGKYSSLSSVNLETRMAELRVMFGSIKEKFSEAHYVQGGSWLYNVPNYRSLFPPSFTRNMPAVIPDDGFNIQRDSVWGQFIDKYGQAKLDVLSRFEDRVKASRNNSDLLLAFPYPVRATHDMIENFYEFYQL